MVRVGGIAAGVIAAALVVAVVDAALAEDGRTLSQAQIALFESNHLKEISHPVVLDYSFHHRGSGGDFDDKISAEIRTVHQDGRKDVRVDFLSGAHRIDYPLMTNFNGNPLLMVFLDHDVAEMHQATGGSTLYFRNRIRQAFVDRAEVHPTEITIDGAKHSATEIDLAPFRQDPNLQRFPGFADKNYRFILSDAVPGTIYEISTSVPHLDASPGLFEDSMTYAGEQSYGGEHAEKQ